MQYRKFGKLGFDISTFGLGCMRLPLEKQPDGTMDSSKIDEKQAIEMLCYAIDHGVNYIDTAYVYHGGNSEPLIAKALKDGYRERVKIATKHPVWKADKYEDFDKILEEQLKMLETDHIDFYLLHALNKETWNKAKALNVLTFLDKALESGKIKYAGFSFHDEVSLFKEIIDSYDKWSMCQVQFNILDEDVNPGIEGIRYAAAKGIPVVVMEPLRGGKLAQNLSKDVQNIWNKMQTERKPVDWAFRWVCNYPEVVVVLSGVSTMEQLKEDLDIFKTALPDTMTKQEMNIIKEVQDYYKSATKVGCTGCRYCMPCPAGVQIESIFWLYDNAMLFNQLDEHRERYRKELTEEGKDASYCVECGNCESACPQHIQIIEKLKEAHEVLG